MGDKIDNVIYFPGNDPLIKENHPSRAAYYLYRMGRMVVQGLDKVGLMGEAAPATLANAKESRRYGVVAIGSLLGGLALIYGVPRAVNEISESITPAVSIADINTAIDECLDDVEEFVPDELKQIRRDECEAMFAPDQIEP